jgi:CBS domain-containing protein
MEVIHQWLQTARARELMTKEVDFLRPTDRLVDAVTLFLRERISGAPVVDETDVCVGVLSATDVMSFDERFAKQRRAPATTKTKSFQVDAWDPAQWWRRLRPDLESQCNECVDRFMTRDVVFVTEDTPLSVVIRQMVSAHVHRILVLDAGRHLKGIISTMDVLAALLRAGHLESGASAFGIEGDTVTAGSC